MDMAKDVAEQELARFAVAMDLDLDPPGLSEEDARDLEKHKRILIDALSCGALVIRETGEPEFRPTMEPEGEPIIFYEPTGATFLATDKRKKGEEMAKANVMLADMTRQPGARFARMKMRDYRVCQSLILLFLA